MLAELVLDEFMELGESPFWDGKEKALYWVDTDLKQVHKYCPYDGRKEKYQLDQKVGCVVKETEDTLICALEKGFYRFNQKDRTQKLLVAPCDDALSNIFNDGKCDKNGRFWAGTENVNELERAAALYCLNADITCEVKLAGVTISNGIAWTEDYTTMYYIDTPTMQVAAFDYDLSTGSISGRRVVIEFSYEDGLPDGMTIDIDGNLWIAMWGGYSVLHCNPETGEIIGKIHIPVSNVTCCTFGGRELSALYITTAKAELSSQEKKEQPYAGGLFKVQTDTRGFPSNRFRREKNLFRWKEEK